MFMLKQYETFTDVSTACTLALAQNANTASTACALLYDKQ